MAAVRVPFFYYCCTVESGGFLPQHSIFVPGCMCAAGARKGSCHAGLVMMYAIG